jgi:hypothetical protein
MKAVTHITIYIIRCISCETKQSAHSFMPSNADKFNTGMNQIPYYTTIHAEALENQQFKFNERTASSSKR